MPTIDLYDLWQSLRNNVNTQQGGFIRPQANFQSWVNEISVELFREKVKEWETTQRISDELSPFLKTVNAVLVEQPGRNYDVLTYPSDYGYFSSARILANVNVPCGCACAGKEFMDGKDGQCKPYDDPDYQEIAAMNAGADVCELIVTKVPNQMWGSACDNSFKKPTAVAPIITQWDGGFKVAPRKLGVIILDYLKIPRKAVFGYTLGVDDNVIYNPLTSVQLEWSESVKGEFLARLQKRYGMFVREEFVYVGSEAERQISK